MKRILLVFIAIVFTQSILVAQDYIVKGRVIDSSNNSPLAGAIVMTTDSLANTISDENGIFFFPSLPSDSTELLFRLLGFNNFNMFVNNASKIDLGDVYMDEEENEIEEVVVTAETPIAVQKGDTTQFNAAAFKTNPDADADDLIMKMPGIVIQNGKIWAQGEEVTQIYVDGELFFGSDPMLALQSLPADAIESIQLFDEPSEQSKMTGITDVDPRKAINIITKNKSEKNTILKLEGAAGVDTNNPVDFRYLTGGNYSFFNKNTKITLTGVTNNVNTASYEDEEDGSDDDDDEVTVDNNGNISGLIQGIKTINNFGVNISHKEGDKFSISGSYYFDNSDNPMVKVDEKDYYAVEGSYDTKDIDIYTTSRTITTNHKLNLRLEYKPNDNNSLVITPKVTYQTIGYVGDMWTATVKDADSVSKVTSYYDYDYKYLLLSGSAVYAHKFDSKPGRSLSANFTYNISDKVTDRIQGETARATYSTSTGLWTDKAETVLVKRLIYQDIESSVLSLKLSYIEPFGTRHKVSFNALVSRNSGGTDYTNDKYNYETELYDIYDTVYYSLFDRVYDAVGTGVSYAYKSSTLDLSVGADVLSQFQYFKQDKPEYDETYNRFMEVRPLLSLKYKITKDSYLRLSYSGQTVHPDLSLMLNILNDVSTYSLKIGNPDLERSYKHTLTSYYNLTNKEKSTNFTVSWNAYITDNYVATSVEEMPADTVIYTSEANRINQVNGYEPVEGASLTKRINLDQYINSKFNATYSFMARPIKSTVNLSLNYNYVRTPSIYYQLNYANIHSTSFRVGLSSNISEKIDFTASSNTIYCRTHNTYLQSYSSVTQNFYVTSKFILRHDFVLSPDVTWRYYQSEGSYFLCNVGLGKKVLANKSGEVKLTVYDILNQNRNIMRYMKTTYAQTVTSNTIGRYLMLKFAYRFNTMNRASKKTPSNGQEVKDVIIDQLKEVSVN